MRKIIIGTLLILSFFLGLYKINWNFSKEKSVEVQPYNNEISEDKKSDLNLSMESPREIAIREYFQLNKYHKEITIDNRNFYLVQYRHSMPSEPKNFPEETYGRQAGIILFTDQKPYWESKQVIQILIQEATEIRDITGDGLPEIILTDDGGGNQPTCIMYIYSWLNTTFKLVSPEYFNPCEGTNPSTAGIIDIDGDRTFELVAPEVIVSEGNESKNRLINHIYKWDGQMYTLWKDEEVSDPVWNVPVQDI